MTNVWYTSDLHFNHKLVSGIRGFKFGDDTPDVKSHNDSIIKYWHKTVKQDDLVIILGDLAVSQHEKALEIVSLLPGRKGFIDGNHDPIHPLFRREAIKPKIVDMYHSVFEFCHPFLRRKVNNYEFLLSHFPYEGDHTREDRFDQYRLRDLGMPLLHGHTHGKETTSMHVGWDAWGRFVNQDEVAEWLATLPKPKESKWRRT